MLIITNTHKLKFDLQYDTRWHTDSSWNCTWIYWLWFNMLKIKLKQQILAKTNETPSNINIMQTLFLMGSKHDHYLKQRLHWCSIPKLKSQSSRWNFEPKWNGWKSDNSITPTLAWKYNTSRSTLFSSA